MSGRATKEIRDRRAHKPRKAKETSDSKKSRWREPANLVKEIAGILLAIIGAVGAFAGPSVSLAAPLDVNDVMTTRFEISNSGFFTLKNVSIVSFEIALQYEHGTTEEGTLGTKYIPRTGTLQAGESETVPLGRFVTFQNRVENADVMLLAYYQLAYAPFWHRRKAFRFKTVRQSDGQLRFEKQPIEDALKQYDALLKRQGLPGGNLPPGLQPGKFE